LGSEVEALTKEKKEKANVFTDLELMNLKNISVLNSEELRRKIAKAEKEKLVEENKECQKNLHKNIQGIWT
jgi:predicted RNase H-like nuclease (RuvC/YqgF family)